MGFNWKTGRQDKDQNEYFLWLIFDDAGSVRMTRTSPATGRGEHAIALTLKAPRSLFRAPHLSATIQVASPDPSDQALVVEAAAEAVRSAIGLDVVVQVLPAGDEGG